jgi:hypothetical protein
VGQNFAAGVAGFVVWPLLFAMDFQDYLATLGRAEMYSRRPTKPAPVRKR